MNNQQDWTGNSRSIFAGLGASNHTAKARAEHDFYATEPKATHLLCDVERFEDAVWEPAAGEGHMSEVLKERGYKVISTDLVSRSYPLDCQDDFLKRICRPVGVKSIITNPPYSKASEFLVKGMELLENGQKMAMFLKLLFLEGQGRGELFKTFPPITIYVSSGRLNCLKNGQPGSASSSVAYAWFIWQKGYNGSPSIKWINGKKGKNG